MLFFCILDTKQECGNINPPSYPDQYSADVNCGIIKCFEWREEIDAFCRHMELAAHLANNRNTVETKAVLRCISA